MQSIGRRIPDFLRGVEKALESSVGRRLFWIVVAALFLLFGIVAVKRAEFPKRRYVDELRYDSPMPIGSAADGQAEYHSSEFRGFRRQAWGAVVEGMDPYDPETFHLRAYPPFFNIVFMPFAAPWRVTGLGGALFYILSFGLTLFSAWCLSQWGRTEGQGHFGLFALIFVLLVPMAMNVIARCETDLLVLAPVAAALMLLAGGRKSFWAGCLLGFAAAFKVLPALFGVYLLCRRKWSAAFGMIAAGLFCTVLLPVIVFGPKRAVDLHISWYRNVVAPYHSSGAGKVIGSAARPSNQSLAAALERYLRPLPVKLRRGKRLYNINIASLSSVTVRRILKGLQALIGLGLVFVWAYCTRKDEKPRTRAVLFGLVAPGILLLSDLSLTTHHVLLLVPLSVMVVRMLEPDDGSSRKWAWVVPLYMFTLLGISIRRVKMFTPLLPLTLVVLLACVVLALRDRAEEGRLRSEK